MEKPQISDSLRFDVRIHEGVNMQCIHKLWGVSADIAEAAKKEFHDHHVIIRPCKLSHVGSIDPSSNK